MTPKKLRVGVVGGGKMGSFHIEKYLSLPDVQFIGVVEPDPIRANLLQKKYAVTIFLEPAALYFEADAVSIASTTATHYGLARQALEFGTHVLVEKPATETVSQGEDLCRLAQEKKLIFQVGYLERFRLRSLYHGKPTFLHATRHQTTPGREPSLDVIQDLMSHDIDLMLFLMGEFPRSVRANAQSFVRGIYDAAVAWFEFSGGRTAVLSVNRLSGEPRRRLELWDKVPIAIDLASPFDALGAQISDFVACAREGRAPVVSGEDGVNVSRVIAAIYDVLEFAPRRRQELPSEGALR